MKTGARCAALGVFLISSTVVVRSEEAGLSPPQGSRLLLELVADGVQIYGCEARDKGFAWTFEAPEAALFDRQGQQIGTHFAGPTWKSSDGSTVVGEVIGKADAPEPGAIPWLLLRAKSHDGAGLFSAVLYIRRTETRAGIAPQTGCDAAHLGEQARMRYAATYQFFGAAPR
jgi:hypothetical protein